MKKFVPLIISLLLCGCAVLPFKTATVAFEDPYTRLGVTPVEPTEEESDGVLLKNVVPAGNILESREENNLFAMIKNGKGKQLEFILDRTDHFEPGTRNDSYVIRSKTSIEGQKGSLLEEKEVSERGEILKFLRGYHRSKIGKFKISAWSRTPLYPETKVKLGTRWTYDESMQVDIDSKWIKALDPRPYEIKGERILEGFALVKGVRCAVIRTRAAQKKEEHFKVFFKEIRFHVQTDAEEIEYLNYKNGQVVAKITKTSSFTKGLNIPFNETGQSQALYYVISPDGSSTASSLPS